MRLYTDSATGILLNDIAVDTTTFFLNSGDGIKFPDPQNYPAEYALLTLENDLGQKEKVILTSRIGDQLTVIRAQEGTIAVAYLAGSRCELRMTASAIQNMFQKNEGDVLDAQAGLGNRIYFKRYTLSGDGPASTDLYEGEIAINLVDKWLWAGGIGAAPGNPVDPIVLSNGPNGALTLVTQNGHGFKVGQPLYYDGVELQLAQSNDIQTCGRYVVKQVIDANTFLAATNGNVTGVVPANVGLTTIVPGKMYYVSDNTAGQYEEEPSDIDPVNYQNPLAVGVTSSALLVTPHQPRQLPAHNDTRNRADNDCHPTSAITGLDTALAAKFAKEGGTITGPVQIVPDAGETPLGTTPLHINCPADIGANAFSIDLDEVVVHAWSPAGRWEVFNDGSMNVIKAEVQAGPVAEPINWKIGADAVWVMGVNGQMTFRSLGGSAAIEARAKTREIGVPLITTMFDNTSDVPFQVYGDTMQQRGNIVVFGDEPGSTFADYGVALQGLSGSKEGKIWVNSKDEEGKFSVLDFTWGQKDVLTPGNLGYQMRFERLPTQVLVSWWSDGKEIYRQGSSSHNFGDPVKSLGLAVSHVAGNADLYAERTGSESLQNWASRVHATDTNTIRQAFHADGTILNYNNIYGQLSARAGKQDISDATPKLGDLNRLRVRHFKRKDDPNQLKMLGLVAEEVAEVFPGLVKEVEVPDDPDWRMGMNRPQKTKKEKMVAYSLLVPMLLKAVQELTEEVEDLRERVH